MNLATSTKVVSNVAKQTLNRTIKGCFDVTIIGGGIVGLATARQVILRNPKLKVCVLEKEEQLASHQSKRNSGVVHCGIYYKKGSLKSKFCIKGAKLAKDYCQAKNLPFNQCGKLIVASGNHELGTLHDLYKNAQANNIDGIKMISGSMVRKIQPGCDSALEAIWSPNTAIVDWQQVALSYAKDFELAGGTIIKKFLVTRFEEGSNGFIRMSNIENVAETIETKSVVNCAGAFSAMLAARTGNNEFPKVLPFKGNYYILSDRLAKTIKTNIYPVPNPKLPFLGVHITPRIDGSVIVGPTSLLVLGYERYSLDDPYNFLQMFQILFLSGLRKMIKNPDYRKAGLKEIWRAIYKPKVLKDVQQFLPDVLIDDLIKTNFGGIRAQVVHRDGQLVDDFMFETGISDEFNKVLHVRNCPSPAATSSLAIAERVVNIIEDRLI